MKNSPLWLSPCVSGQSFTRTWWPVVLLLLAFTVSPALAHTCGPTTITVEVGKTVTWRIKADVSESQETAYGLVVLPDSSLVEVGPTGPFFEFNYGQWTIYGKQVGTTTMTANWAYSPNSASGSCSVTINVVPTSSRPKPASEEPNAGDSSDPVNTANGELFFENKPDIAMDGPMPLEFKRYYSSLMLDSGVPQSNFGVAWRHNFDLSMSRISTNATITFLNGRPIRFQQAAGNWNLVAPLDVRYQLREVGANYVMMNPEDRRRYTFDAQGRLLTIKDRNDNTLTITYSDGGNGMNPSTISDGLGRTLTITYFGFQLLRTVSDGTRTVTFNYSNDRIGSVVDTRGLTTAYNYDSFSGDRRVLLLDVTRPLANKPVSQTFDGNLRVATQKDGSNNVHTFTYSGLQTTVTAPDASTVVHTHDANGRLLSSERTDAGTIKVNYDASGLRNTATNASGVPERFAFDQTTGYLEYVTNALGGVTQFAFTNQTDADGFTYREVSRITHPDGTFEAFFYNASGNRLVIRDRSGGTRTFTYNSRGQLLTEVNLVGGTTTSTYNGDGTLATRTDPAGNMTSYAYDTLKRLIKITHADTTFRQWNYDAADHILNWTNEVGQVVQHIYDNNGNLSTLRDAAGNLTTYTYDLNDRLRSITDRNSRVTTYSYDTMGRIKQLVSPNNAKVGYGYDSAGNMRYITNTLGRVRTNYFDANGRMTAAVDTLGQTNQYEFDAQGRIIGTISPENNERDFSYDSSHRITSFQGSGGRPTNLKFDGRGWVTNMAVLEPGASASFQRNAMGQITKLTTPRGDQWNYAYDTSGRPTTETDPLGKVTTSTHNNRNRVGTMTFPDSMGSVQLTYNGVNDLTRRLYSDGLDLNYTYDAVGRLTGVNGVDVAYDKEGRISSCNGITNTIDLDTGRLTVMQVAPGKNVTYTYDLMGRVTQVTDWAGGVTTLGYDGAGQLTNITRPNGLITTYTYNKDGRLTGLAVNNNLCALTLAYDGEGNLTTDSRHQPLEYSLASSFVNQQFSGAERRTGTAYDALGRATSSGGTTFTWNLAGFLTAYNNVNHSVQLQYNGFGHVTRRTESAVSRDFVWNYSFYFPRITKEKRNGSDHRYYVHLPAGQLLYSLEAVDNSRTFYHFDEMGNTLFLSDASGNPTAVYAYLPYGEKQVDGNPGENLFTFQGAWSVVSEAESNLYIMGVRPYDAASGRFLSRDQAFPNLNPQALNPYAYAAGNPLRYFDPLGMAPNAASSSTSSAGANVAEGVRATVDSAGAIQGMVGDAAEVALGKAQTLAKATTDTFGEGSFFVNGATQAIKAEQQASKLNGLVNGKGMKALGHAGTGAQLIGVGMNMWRLHERLGHNASEYDRGAANAVHAAELMAKNAFDAYARKEINIYVLKRRLIDANFLLRMRLLELDDTYYADLALDSFRTGLESLGSFIPDFGLFTGRYIDGATSLGQSLGTDKLFDGILY
jgi:RHS repeat-associated protein